MIVLRVLGTLAVLATGVGKLLWILSTDRERAAAQARAAREGTAPASQPVPPRTQG